MSTTSQSALAAVSAAASCSKRIPSGEGWVYIYVFLKLPIKRVPLTLFIATVPESLIDFPIFTLVAPCIGAAKITNFEVNCRLLEIHPTVHLFRAFYHTSWSNGWISFYKRAGRLHCYTEKLDALRRWREMFFWVDDALVPLDFAFSKYPWVICRRDERCTNHAPGSYSSGGIAELINENRIPINAYSKALHATWAFSRNYFQSHEESSLTFIGDDRRGLLMLNFTIIPLPLSLPSLSLFLPSARGDSNAAQSHPHPQIGRQKGEQQCRPRAGDSELIARCAWLRQRVFQEVKFTEPLSRDREKIEGPLVKVEAGARRFSGLQGAIGALSLMRLYYVSLRTGIRSIWRGKGGSKENFMKRKLLTVPVQAQVPPTRPGYNDKAIRGACAGLNLSWEREVTRINPTKTRTAPPIDVIMSGVNLGKHRHKSALRASLITFFLQSRNEGRKNCRFLSMFATMPVACDILNPFALEREIPLKETLEAHAIRHAKKRGKGQGNIMRCWLQRTDRPFLRSTELAGQTESPK
ncbi:hypothetical protein Tco_1291808 [Tanacetum coccineum]